MSWIITDDSKNHITKDMDHGPDRIAAIVAAAYFERQLDSTLRHVLEPNKDIANKLFKGYGPIATFSAKIDLAYMLGMYQVSTHKALHTIKDIRNIFAHHPERTTFKTQRIQDLCKNLSPPVWKKKFPLSNREAVGLLNHIKMNSPGNDYKWINKAWTMSMAGGPDTVRSRYMMTIKMSLLYLELIKMVSDVRRKLDLASREISKFPNVKNPVPNAHYWPWPSFDKSEEQSPPAPQRGGQRQKKQRPQRKSSPA